KNNNDKEKNELYEVLGALCVREQIQIEDKGDYVEITACPQGKIRVTEEDDTILLSANTRHGGPGFHCFVVDFYRDIKEEIPGEYELIDDLEFDLEEDFRKLHSTYEEELEYIRGILIKNDLLKEQNYLYEETFFLPMNKKGRILTSVGDIDEKEFKEMSLLELMDCFYVWNDWDKDARFFKNAALTLLAKEGVGIYTNMNETTIKHAQTICDYIELAFEDDPKLPLPVKNYKFLIEQLGRENKLNGAIQMKEEVIQYRDGEVYHLFESAKVVAHGACERSYDPQNRCLCLMAPYVEEATWKYLIQASLNSSIMTDYDNVSKQIPIAYDGKSIYMSEWKEDGFFTIEAIVQRKEEQLFFHCIVANQKNLAYIRQCIKESDFQKGID
ncbi:MAG: hypothetical protein HUJ53_10775, partial [Holdemanella sp.]|nr:hypothetical protein [Holdemanella sp.]